MAPPSCSRTLVLLSFCSHQPREQPSLLSRHLPTPGHTGPALSPSWPCTQSVPMAARAPTLSRPDAYPLQRGCRSRRLIGQGWPWRRLSGHQEGQGGGGSGGRSLGRGPRAGVEFTLRCPGSHSWRRKRLGPREQEHPGRTALWGGWG